MEDKNMSEVKKATRDGFGEEIVKLGKLDNDCLLYTSTKWDIQKAALP